MSKVSRQTAKQNRSSNKQNNGQTVKEDQTLKATTDQTLKPVQAGNKQAVDQSTRQGLSAGRATTRQAAKYERRREEQRRREEGKQQAAQRKRLAIVGGIVAAVLVLGIVSYFVYTGYVHPSKGSAQTPAATVVNPSYPPIDGVSCDTLEQTAAHYHAHLSVYINGQQVSIPSQIGIAPDGSCFYWLHTHSNSGVIHIEAPPKHTFTLGNFLDVWAERFTSLQFPSQLNQPGGTGWQVYVNGQLVGGNFYTIVLKAHMLITLAYNSPNAKPDTSYAWNGL